MSWDKNPYYNADQLGLKLVAEFEMSEPCYSFDTLAVWLGEKGYYLGTDSGCSCPTPFESYNGLDDLTGPLTVDGALEEATSLRAANYEPTYDEPGWEKFTAEVRDSERAWLQERLAAQG